MAYVGFRSVVLGWVTAVVACAPDGESADEVDTGGMPDPDRDPDPDPDPDPPPPPENLCPEVDVACLEPEPALRERNAAVLNCPVSPGDVATQIDTNAATWSVARRLSAVAVVDLDLDGEVSVVVGDRDGGVAVVEGGAVSELESVDPAWTLDGEIADIRVVDLDVDGAPELLVHSISDSPNPGADSILTLIRPEEASSQLLVRWDRTVTDVQVGDFDGDGAVDIVALDDIQRGLLFVPGLENGAMGQPRCLMLVPSEGTHGLQAADRDGDGEAELYASTGSGGHVIDRVDLEACDGAARLTAVASDGLLTSESLAAADIGGDGMDEIVLMGHDRLAVLAPDPEVPTVRQGAGVSDTFTHVVAGDLDGNGDAEVVVLAGTSVAAYDDVGGCLFDVWSRPTIAGTTFDVTTGDVDGNGREDIIVVVGRGEPANDDTSGFLTVHYSQ